MRYLYGDSTPFPLGYNFLATLEAFMAAATRIVQIDVEGQRITRQRDEIAQNRVKGVEALEQFHNVVMRAVQDTAQKVEHQLALDYAAAIADYATHYIEEHRRTTLASNERELVQIRSESERRAREMRAHLEAFLKSARFPVLKTKLSVSLTVDGKDARHSGTAGFEHPNGISTEFTIAPHRSPAWVAPRKVSEFVEGVDLRIGVEKSWLRGTVTPKVLNVDDWTIMKIDMSDEAFELVLRRKLTEKEMLLFRLHRTEAGVVEGTLEHSGASGAEELPSDLAAEDVGHLERLWVALTTAMRDVVQQKEQLLNVSLDAQPVFESGLAVPFVVRLVAMFAPTAREIAKRSPNEFELTLKIENEGGRREELYLRKDALVSTLQPLPAKGREVFAPLGLDKWVPGVTAPPPAVTLQEPAAGGSNASPQHPAVPPIPSAPASRSKL